MKAIEKKQQTVDAIVESFKDAAAVYLLNFEGITVEKDNALRRSLKKNGVKYRAIKNTLLKRVLEKMGESGLDAALTGGNDRSGGHYYPWPWFYHCRTA